MFGGGDAVREERQRAARIGTAPHAGEKALDLIADLVGVCGRHRVVVIARHLDELGSRDVLRRVPSTCHRHGSVTGVVKNQGRNADGRDHGALIHLEIYAEDPRQPRRDWRPVARRRRSRQPCVSAGK